ncbi:MAG: DNA polymerase III subunit delta' [Candidatus Omnitrophica bacterium]|nr:DNA polymerase III subunit delta' [Candidatus Omnitrophota bacterium]
MILLKDIKDQNKTVRYLSNSLLSGRRANSYLFFGPEGVGRALCAKAFIATLICPEKKIQSEACGVCPACLRIERSEHPDLIWIKPGKNKAIKIDEIRKVKNILNLKPYEASNSVCVIEDAHFMTTAASNALLKVMEEPPGDALFILITSKKELLLETVVSRCSEVKFGSMSVNTVKDIIMEKENSIDEKDAKFLAVFSQGSPGRALEMIKEDISGRKDRIFAMMDMIVKEKNAGCLNWISDHKDKLLEDIEMLIMSSRDAVMYKEGLDDLILDRDIRGYKMLEGYGVDKIQDVLESLINMKLALRGNVNSKLAAQVLPGMLK